MTLSEVVQHLRRTLTPPGTTDLSDRELLNLFLKARQDSAFAVLVRRHGPMVQGVCKRILQDHHAAEDAFQATFLVLVRRATSIRKKPSLASWLHGVARRVAHKARTKAAGQEGAERIWGIMACAEALDELTLQELRTVLDEEIGRLPEKYAAPIVLCYLEGKSYDQAAKELGCPKSSLASRLARARETLRDTLSRRGITLSAGVLSTALAERVSGGALGALLTISTVKAAVYIAAGNAVVGGPISAGVMALAQETLAAMVATKVKFAAAAMIFCVAISGAGFVGYAKFYSQEGEQSGRTPTQRVQVDKSGAKEQASPNLADFNGDPLPVGALARLGTTRFRHGFVTFGVAFAPNGKVLASAGRLGGGVCIWDVTTGSPLHRLSIPDLARGVAFSPNGKWLVTGGRAVFLIDVATGKELRRFEAPSRSLDLDSVAFSSDGRTVAAGETGGSRPSRAKGSAVILWNAETGKEIRRLSGHENVTAVAFSPDGGKILASASSDKKVRLWDVASGNLLRVVESNDMPISVLAFAPDGRILAAAGDDRVVRLWSVDAGEQLCQLKGHETEVTSAVFSPNGKILASQGRRGKVYLWDANTGLEIRHWDAGTGPGGGLAFSPSGQTLASACGSSIRLWDPGTGKEIKAEAGHTSNIELLQFAPDGKTLVSCAQDKKVLEWDLATGQPRVLGANIMSFTADLSADGKTFAQVIPNDPRIHVCNTATGKELFALNSTAKDTRLLKFSSNNELLVSSSDDGFRLWELATGKVLEHIKENQFSPLAVAFSQNSKLLAFAGSDKTLRLWDIQAAKELRRWETPEDYTRILAFSPDGKTLLSYGNSGSDLRIWATSSGKQLMHFTGIERILSLAFSPGGRFVAFADLEGDNHQGVDDKTACALRLLEVSSGQEIRKIDMPQGSVWSLAFAPDGCTLATGGGDSSILLWDIAALAAGDGKPINPKMP
jgi:RNA polymerase sigma factor (sigma-70 family)